MKRRHLVVCGRSLFLAGIAVSLKDCPNLQVALLDPTLPGITARLNEMDADAVIFDLTATDSKFALAFLEKHPGVQLLGLDLASNKMVSFSSQRSTISTMDELARIVNGQDRVDAMALD